MQVQYYLVNTNITIQNDFERKNTFPTTCSPCFFARLASTCIVAPTERRRRNLAQ